MKVSPTEYHSKLLCNRENVFSEDSWLSKSVIQEYINGSPFKWRYYPRQYKPTPSMTWGSLVDCLVTTPDEIGDVAVISPFDSFRTKEAKAWKEEALQAGRIIVNATELQEAQKAANMILKKNKDSAAIFKGAACQYMLTITAEQFRQAGVDEIKVNIKGLLDVLPNGNFLADLKTTNDFSYRGFESTIQKFGYHHQAGLYLALWNLLNPDDQRDRWLFVWQDRNPPYEVAVTELNLADINAGKDGILQAIKDIQNHTERNYWPMKYEGEQKVIGRPMWALMDEEENLA